MTHEETFGQRSNLKYHLCGNVNKGRSNDLNCVWIVNCLKRQKAVGWQDLRMFVRCQVSLLPSSATAVSIDDIVSILKVSMQRVPWSSKDITIGPLLLLVGVQ